MLNPWSINIQKTELSFSLPSNMTLSLIKLSRGEVMHTTVVAVGQPPWPWKLCVWFCLGMYFLKLSWPARLHRLRKASEIYSLNLGTLHNVQRYNTYSVTKRTVSQTLSAHWVIFTKTLCNFIRSVTLYVMLRLRLRFGTLLCCGHLRFVTLRHVTFTLCCFTLCNLWGARKPEE